MIHVPGFLFMAALTARAGGASDSTGGRAAWATRTWHAVEKAMREGMTTEQVEAIFL